MRHFADPSCKFLCLHNLQIDIGTLGNELLELFRIASHDCAGQRVPQGYPQDRAIAAAEPNSHVMDKSQTSHHQTCCVLLLQRSVACLHKWDRFSCAHTIRLVGSTI